MVTSFHITFTEGNIEQQLTGTFGRDQNSILFLNIDVATKKKTGHAAYGM
jgi:hypothetical protein